MRKKLFLPIILLLLLTAGLTVSAEEQETYISETAREACVEYGQQYGICSELLMAIVETESNGIPTAENGGCMGLMQISQKWHTDRMKRLGVTDIFDERGNILVGTDYLAELRDKHGDMAMVLIVYNGDSRAKDFYKTGYISGYALKIMQRSAELEEINEREAMEDVH